MKLLIISGRSGAGKNTVLRTIEDEGFTCIDNVPASMLKDLINKTNVRKSDKGIAVCIDSRNNSSNLENFQAHLLDIDASVDTEIIFLDASSEVLIKRYSETRRKHPLTSDEIDLRQAIDLESIRLAEISDVANLRIETSDLTPSELTSLIRTRVVSRKHSAISMLFCSFGFRNGIPVDADYVFDLRCLPNPFYEENIKNLSGKAPEVRAFLDSKPLVKEMFTDIVRLLENWLPHFDKARRHYITVAVGCTGGRHRSVYMAERLAKHFQMKYDHVIVRHRDSADAT